MVLGLGAAAFLDLAVGYASGLLHLGQADQTLAPNRYWRCMLDEAVATVGAIVWICFGGTL